jgi:transcriptional regulator with XRE-family HTH domain
MAMVSKMKIERLRKGYTLETLEKSCGVPYYRLWMIENGLLPKPDQIVEIAQALDVTPRDIFPVFEESQWQEYLVVQ